MISKIRLQKFLSERGIDSRRNCAEIIKKGLITVNGVITTEPGFHVDPDDDSICFQGKHVSKTKEKKRTIALYKPRGYICSTSDKDGKTVYELIKDIPERLLPVGRLDKDSEGLLLMSNDGDLINRLTHPRYEHEKTYEVTVSGTVDNKIIDLLQSRLLIDGYRIQPAKVKFLRQIPDSNRTLLEFRLKEGRNRQIRKMCELANLNIHRLIRKKTGNVSLTGLKPGKWREINVH